ncbi:MAG TPA: outer membrane beta-barrel protein [Chitinophagaceae bacterium]
MKKLALIIALGAFGFSASAQNSDEKKTAATTLSVGVEAGLPMGTFGDVSSFGIGGSLKAAIPAGPGAVTVSAGYMNFSGKDFTVGSTTFKASSTYFIPLKAGYRLNLGEGGFNIEPQLGYSVGKSGGGGFTYAGNIGYMINNQFDIAARYEGVSKDGSSLSFIGLRVAYSFGL